jgi:basic amino acid/polyamine antiporter, APA family
VITTAKYLGVAFLAFVGLTVSGIGNVSVPIPTDAAAYALTPTFTGSFAALVSVMWTYDGWADLSTLSGEVRQPAKTLPRALIMGTCAIIAVYLAAHAGYARVLGLDGLRASTTGSNMAAANLATIALGPSGRTMLSALVLISCLGGCMSSLFTGSRVFVPLAADGLFVRSLGAISPRAHIPARAVIVAGVLGVSYVTVRSFEQLTDAFVVGFFPFYALAVGAVFVLRRREPHAERPFRVPGYPWIPIMFLLGAFVLMFGALADADPTALSALAVVLAGFPVRWIWQRWKQNRT